MLAILTVLAILVPGLPMADQPYISTPPLTPWEEHALLMEIPRGIEEARADAQEAQAVEIPEAGGDPSPPTPPEAPASTQRVGDPWQALADCESGDWLGDGWFAEGTARWRWAAPGEPVPFGTTIHHGGLQFLPSTWEWVAGDLGILGDYPHAYDAPPLVQVEVAEETQRRQGWEAWPVCSRKVGLR